MENPATCINDVLPHYMNDSAHQTGMREDAALEAAGFTLEMVPTPYGGTWPKWTRDGVTFNSSDDALALPLTASVLVKARKASRSRAI